MSRALTIRITRRAAAQIGEAVAWWIENRPAAPDAIFEELERAFTLLAIHPNLGANARNTHLPGVRRIHLGRIHYHLSDDAVVTERAGRERGTAQPELRIRQ